MAQETYIKKNGDFVMRELTEADLEQFNDLLRYAFQVTSGELLKSGWEDDEIKYAKTPILKDVYKRQSLYCVLSTISYESKKHLT